MDENLNYCADRIWSYDNDSSGCYTYGPLYDCAALMQGETSRDSIPGGVQGDEEWKELEMQLGISQTEADITGSRGTNEGSKLAGNASSWISDELTGNSAFDEPGFTALPGGSRNDVGDFYDIGRYVHWWSSTEASSAYAWYRSMRYINAHVNRYGYDKEYGFSVRCVRD